MADVNANIGVNIDTSDALAQLKSLQRQISQFHTSIAKSSETAAVAQRSLQKNLLGSINSIGAFSAELRTVKTSAESFTNSLEKNKFSMREYFRYAGASTKTFGKVFKSEFDTIGKVAEERVKTLQTQYIKLGRNASGAMEAIAVRPTSLNMQDYGTKVQIAAQKQALFNQLMKQGSTNLLNFGKNTQWAGRQLMVGFTIPLAVVGSAATKTFMEMEAQALKFKKVYGDLFTPQAETQQALENITELGQMFTKYGISVSQTVGLAAEAAAAGFQGMDLQRQTTEATRLSVLGQIDAQKALETTISLQNAFGMSSENLASSIDFLNAVENQTVVSLDDITTAIPKVAPVIQQLGGDVKDLTFFMAAMKEGGINASEGANALKSGLAALINPTGRANEMLKSFGINANEIVTKNKGNLKATVIEFATALNQLDPLNRAQAIEQMFGKFQFARLSTLFANVAKDGNQAARVLDLANSSVESLSALSEQELGMTADSAMNKFKKTVEDLKAALIPVGKTFLEAVTPIVEFVGNILEKFNNLSSGVKKAITILVTVIGGLGPVLLMTFGLLANGVANIIKLFLTLRNGYQRLTGQSQILGEQTQYLTQEQMNAAAVASSLDQRHATLAQTFNVETAELTRLIAAYQAATSAGQKFAAINPGAMMPPRRKGFAAGGIISGPGSGTSDLIPIMASNGEAIIPAKNVKRYPELTAGLVAGNIPGFKKGTVGVGIERAHATGAFAQSSPQFQSALDMVAGLKELNKQFPGIIRVVSDLTAELPMTLNQAMKEIRLKGGKVSGGVDVGRFASEYGTLENKFTASAGRGGANIQDPGVQAELLKFEKMVGQRAVQIGNATKDLKVTDTIFAQATREVIDEFTIMEGNAKKVGLALDAASKKVGQIRVQPSQDDYRRGLASGAFSVDPTGKVARFGNIDVARPKAPTKAGLPQARNASNINMRGNYTTGRDLATVANQVTDSAVLETARAAGTKSPSKRTIPIGEDIARGLEVGMANRQDDVAKAGANLGNVATQSAGRTSRRATRPQGAPLSTVASQMPISPEVKSATVEQAKIIKNTNQRMQALDRNIMGASFAISSLSGIASMSGGKLGEMSGTIAKVTGSLFALQAVTGLLTQTNLVALAKKRLEIAGFMGVNKVTGLFSGGIKSLLPNLLRFGGMITRFLGPVGLAITAITATVSIIRLVNKARERERLAIEGLGNAANLAEKQINTLGDFFGIVARKSSLGSPLNEIATSSEERTKVDALKQNEQFKKDFGKEIIPSIKSATDQQASLIFNSLSVQLRGSGFAKEQIETIITALKEEAGKTNIEFDFAKLDLTTDAGMLGFQDSINKLSTELGTKFSTGYVEKVKYGVNRATGETIQWTEKILSKDLQRTLNLTTGAFTSMIDGIAGQLKNGTISADQFSQAFARIKSNLAGMPKPEAILIVDEIMKTLPEKLQKTAGGLSDYSDKMLIIEAQSVGATSGIFGVVEAMTILDQVVRFGPEDAMKRAFAQQTINAFMKRLDDAKNKWKSFVSTTEETNPFKNLEDGDGEDSPYVKAIKDLEAQRKEVGYTTTAFLRLKSVGTETARAYELARNPILAAALATTEVGTDEWEKLLKLIRLLGREELKNLTTGELFDKLNTQATEYFGILEAEIQDRFEEPLRKAEKAAQDAADEVNKIQEDISTKQNVVNTIQRKIEETITRPIGELQDEIDNLQRKIETSIDRPINALQAESTILSENLTIIDKAAEGINSKYDAQEEALSKISSLNQEIANQQKQQLGLADALSQGDIAAAAAAAQEMRASSAAAQQDTVASGLKAAREAELGALVGPNGMTRDQIASRQYEIDRQIYALEQSKLPIQAEILSKQDSIYKLELLRQPLVKDIRDKEDEIYKIQTGKLLGAEKEAKNRAQELKDVQAKLKEELDGIEAQKEKWSDTQLAIDLAKIKAGDFEGVINTTKNLMTDIVNGWNGLSSKDIELRITTVRTEIVNTLNKPINSSGGGGSSSDSSGGGSRIDFQRDMYGGLVKKMASGGFVPGRGMIDKVPTLLTPGEFVMNKTASKTYGPLLSQLNESKYPSMIRSGYSNPGQSNVSTSINNNSSAVYNYSVGINVGGSNTNADDVANAVISQIKYIDAQRIRGQR
jgi:TP901 family phage tail tape measure protein